MLKNVIEKFKNSRNNNKVVTHECFEKKEYDKNFNMRAESYEASKKEMTNEAFEYRKKDRRLNANLTECQRELKK